jgi:hypothetical protein
MIIKNKIYVKEIKDEIKKLSKLLNNLHPDRHNIITNIEGIRHREQDVFEVDAIELVDERASEYNKKEI